MGSFCHWLIQAQETDSLEVTKSNEILYTQEVIKEAYDPLALTSCILLGCLPGLGQAYNKKYWKIPIIYIGIGTSIYLRIDNEKSYNRYRDAYKRRLAGYTDDEFQGVSDETLIRAQRRTNEIWMLVRRWQWVFIYSTSSMQMWMHT